MNAAALPPPAPLIAKSEVLLNTLPVGPASSVPIPLPVALGMLTVSPCLAPAPS